MAKKGKNVIHIESHYIKSGIKFILINDGINVLSLPFIKN